MMQMETESSFRIGEPTDDVPATQQAKANKQVLAIEQAAFEAKGKWVPFFFADPKVMERLYNKLKRRRAGAYDVTYRSKEQAIYVRFKN